MSRFIALAAVLLSAAPALSQPDRVAAEARKVFKRHCVACHKGEGSESGYKFDVLNRETLLKDFADDEKAVVVPKKLDSRIWVRAGIEKTMPPRAVKDRPTAEELEVLKQWIGAGATPFPAAKARNAITTFTALKAIHDHLNSAASQTRPYLRYFTFTNLHNNPAVGEEDLRIARAAFSKALNSMSRSPRIALAKAIDPDEAIYVIDLRDFDWHKNHLWQTILAEYPYGLSYKGSDDPKLIELQKNLDHLTRQELVYIRADWFIATATRPPLYYALLQLPETTAELRKWLQVDREANFRADKLWRAGFQASGVSAQNRLLERHDSPVGGYYWESYDFKPRRARASLLRFPLGPVFEGNPYPNQAFVHDGGEMIFGLPNGLQGYFLADGKGKRINEGPVDVVSDALKTSGSPAIVNGMSCMNCHKYGMIGFTDTIREGNSVFGDAREKVQRLYPEKKTMDELVKVDEDRFVAGLEKAIGPFLKVGDDARRPIRDFGEPVGEVTRAYLLTDVSLEKAAIELGIEKPETLAAMIKGNQKLKELGLLPLANAKVLKRDDWEVRDGTSLFQDAALALGIGTPHNPR